MTERIEPGHTEATTDRVTRLERALRRQRAALAVLAGAAVFSWLGGLTGLGAGSAESAQPAGTGGANIKPDTIMGMAIENDVIYRIRADGVVEQVAIGSRRAALRDLRNFAPQRQVPGLVWQEVDINP